MPSMILLNASGDVEITWSEEYEDDMRALIEQRIKDGYVFFKIKKVFGVERKVKLRSIDEVKVGTKLLLKDADAIRLFSEGKIKAGKTQNTKYESEGRIDDPEVILKSDSLAIKPIAAG